MTQVHDASDLQHSAPEAFRFYRRALATLEESGVPFLVGGAYAFAHYTGIVRHTKDLDIFLHPGDVDQVLKAFARTGHHAEMVFSHWLAKVYHSDDFIDIIFSSGNGICAVDEAFFTHSRRGEVLGHTVQLMPSEEMIWQKSFIMERERFDGADVIHLLRACGRELNWDRLLTRFHKHWRVLLGHLILFEFVYPGDRQAIPACVMRALLGRLEREGKEADDLHVCQGTLLSRTQYLPDVEDWHLADPRVAPKGPMSPEETERWTDAGR